MLAAVHIHARGQPEEVAGPDGSGQFIVGEVGGECVSPANQAIRIEGKPCHVWLDARVTRTVPGAMSPGGRAADLESR